MKRLMAVLLVVGLVLSTAVATADLKRGDRGESVQYMQEKLIFIGALDDKADGIFGKKTEKAVKDVQGFMGLKETGKANEAFMDELDYLYYLLNDEGETGLSEEEMEEYGILTWCKPGPEEDGGGPCFRHSLMDELKNVWATSEKTVPGIERRLLEREIELWLRSIRNMYTDWEMSAPEEERGEIRNQRDSFEKVYAEKHENWIKTAVREGEELRNESVWLGDRGEE